ncbi:D-malate degradation protein R [Marinibacterium anthonyi]|nr:D-malate degradation protein R [Marinibacterium anthonyi]
MDLFDGLKAFVATARTGSFTAAGETLGLSNRLTSKYVAELEERLRVRLFQRTTRKVGLTPAGEELMRRAPALLDELSEMLASVSDETGGFSGGLRISAPLNFGELYVKDMLIRFTEAHPDLTVDLRLNDSYADLARDGIDLAFRIGVTEVSSVKVRKLGQIESRLVAAPEYLDRHGTPERPQDLAGHACVIDSNRHNPTVWVFGTGVDAVEVRVTSRFQVNSAHVARDLAIAGRGIAYCPKFVLGTALEDGQLVRLLEGHEGPPHPLNAIYLEGRTLPRKVRALIDFAQKDIRSAGIL